MTAEPVEALAGPALLFCPGHRPSMFAKAATRADTVVIDLEDAVPPDERSTAREALAAHPLDPDRTVVRINAVGTSDHAADLAALRRTDYRTVMLAKTETAGQVAGLADWRVVALCETPLGILHATAIAAVDNTAALMWGSEDLMAALGAASARRPDRGLRSVAEHARSSVLFAAKAHGRSAIDTVFPDFIDVDGLAVEAREAAGCGYDGKACIHPSQADVVRAAFQPTDEQVAWARRITAAARADGVSVVDGQMVDAPVLRRARSILDRRTGPTTDT